MVGAVAVLGLVAGAIVVFPLERGGPASLAMLAVVGVMTVIRSVAVFLVIDVFHDVVLGFADLGMLAVVGAKNVGRMIIEVHSVEMISNLNSVDVSLVPILVGRWRAVLEFVERVLAEMLKSVVIAQFEGFASSVWSANFQELMVISNDVLRSQRSMLGQRSVPNFD